MKDDLFGGEDPAGSFMEGEGWGFVIPAEEWPTQLEEQYIVKDIIDSATAKGSDPLTLYIAFKQLERLSKLGIAQMKERATEYVAEELITEVRGAKVSMRGVFGGYEFPPAVALKRQALSKKVSLLKKEITELENESHRAGHTKLLPGRRGLTITFRKM